VLLIKSLRNRGSTGHYKLLVQSLGNIDGHSVENAKAASIQATDWWVISSLVYHRVLPSWWRSLWPAF